VGGNSGYGFRRSQPGAASSRRLRRGRAATGFVGRNRVQQALAQPAAIGRSTRLQRLRMRGLQRLRMRGLQRLRMRGFGGVRS